MNLAYLVQKGEMGLPSVLTAKTWGFYDVLFKGKPFEFQRPYGSYIMENVLFKISYPAEFHAQTAVECAYKLHDKLKSLGKSAADIANDPFVAYFSGALDPSIPPKVLITTSPKATRTTYDLCDEIVNIFPGAEFIRRKKGKGFEVGRIAGWAANRGYSHLMVVNEDMKKPSENPPYYLPLAIMCLTSACSSIRRHYCGPSP